MAEEEVFTGAQLHTPRRPLTLRRVPVGFHPSTPCRRVPMAVDRFTPGNAIRHLERVHTGRLGFASLRFTEIEQRLPVRVHTLRQPSDNQIKLIVSRDSRLTEIQPSEACGTSETPETTSGTETISGTEIISLTETISVMEIIFVTEIIIFVVTGKNTSSRGIRGIGTAIGTITATTGGMVTGAPSSTERG